MKDIVKTVRAEWREIEEFITMRRREEQAVSDERETYQ